MVNWLLAELTCNSVWFETNTLSDSAVMVMLEIMIKRNQEHLEHQHFMLVTVNS